MVESTEARRHSRLREELEELKRRRDELRLQLNLGEAELRDRWEHAERRLHEVEGEVERLARKTAEQTERAVRTKLAAIREAYEKFWDQR